MIPMEELWKRIGKVPTLESALEIVLSQRTRYGRGVRSQSPALEATRSESNRAILEQTLREVEQESGSMAGRTLSPTAERKLHQLELQRHILTAMTKFGDRRIHATELAAALILVHGLNEEKLRPFFNAAARLDYKTKPPFAGSMSNNAKILGNNTLERLHEVLRKEPGFYATGVDLQRKLGENRASVTTGLGLLDLVGAVHKLPFDSSTWSLVWTHASNKPPEPWWNTPYLILSDMERRQEPVSRVTFINPITVVGRTVSGEQSLGSMSNIRDIFSIFEKSGLVEQAGKTNRGPLFKLTDSARQWIAETKRTGVLHPRLRETLLGTVEVGRPPLEPRREQAILREIRLRTLLEKQPDRTATDVAKELQMPLGSISAYRKGMSSLKRFQTDKLLEIADYFDGKKLAEEADYLRRLAASKQLGKFLSR